LPASSTGTVGIWLLNGLALKTTWAYGATSSNWQIVQIGDYNGSSTSDILWRDTNTGQAAIWYINPVTGALLTSSGIGTVATDWTIQRVGAD